MKRNSHFVCSAAALLSMALALTGCRFWPHSPKAMTELELGNHCLGGNVRGFGVLAEYGSGGPRVVELVRDRRQSKVRMQKDYGSLPEICSLRVLDPDGKTVAVQDLSAQKEFIRSYRVEIPYGKAGVWRFAVSNGHDGDVYTLRFPETNVWGVRGEMSFVLQPDFPLKWNLYIPKKSAFLLTELFPNGRTGAEIRISSNGKLLSRTAQKGRRFLGEITKPALPNGEVVDVEFTPETVGCAVAFDGVNALLCPTKEAALKLKNNLRVVEGVTVAGPVQERARRILLKRKASDYDVKLKFAEKIPADLKNPQLEMLAFGKYGPLAGTDYALKTQILDPKSPFCGASGDPAKMKDWQTGIHTLYAPFESAHWAGAYFLPTRLNPAHKHPGVRNRAVAAAFYHFISMQGDDIIREGDFRGNNYPQVHAFFVYDALAKTYLLIHRDLDRETRDVYHDALIAVGDKIAAYQGYMSNQYLDVVSGHLDVYKATGERRFLTHVERIMNVFLDNAYGPDNSFGQHACGYYMENLGPDGNYDHLNSYSMALIYHAYRALPVADKALVEKMKKAIQKNLCYKSFHWLPQPNGGLGAPCAMICRTDTSVANASYPGDSMTRKEFDLAYTRAMMYREPAKMPGMAAIFSHVVNTDRWALETIRFGLKNKGARETMHHGIWANSLYESYTLPQTAKKVQLPFEAEEGIWELPGQIAWKQKNGQYGLVFYAVAGAKEPRFRRQGVLSAGPLVLWTKELGNSIASSRNSIGNQVRNENDITWTGVFGKDAKGNLLYNSQEFNKLEWLTPKKVFRIGGDFRMAKGRLDWIYELQPEGLRLTVTLNVPEMKNPVLNLPFAIGSKIPFGKAEKGSFVFGSGKDAMRVTWNKDLPGNLTAPLHGRVRILRIPFPADGKIVLNFTNGNN